VCSLHLCFCNLQLAYTMTKCWPSRVDLSEDDPEASWLFVVLKAGIHNEGMQAVTVRINYNRF
jgi:hypothetical protein